MRADQARDGKYAAARFDEDKVSGHQDAGKSVGAGSMSETKTEYLVEFQRRGQKRWEFAFNSTDKEKDSHNSAERIEMSIDSLP